MTKASVAIQVEDSLYEELLAVADKAGRSIEDCWSDRLNTRLRMIFDELDSPDGQ